MHNTTISVHGCNIAAIRFNPGGSHRVLAVHGWLDNANSFSPLAAHLADVDLVAIDLPGHGHSDHFGPAAHYHFLDMQHWLIAAAQNLGWDQFHFLGHSLGGCIAPFVAVAKPKAVRSIIMLEASGPLTEGADQLPERLQRAAQDYIAIPKYKSRCFTTIEQAIDARLQATTMTYDAARLIVERQLKQTKGGYSWRYDQRHRSASAVYLTEQQVLAVLAKVPCTTLCITAADGYLTGREHTAQRLSKLADLQHVEVPGDHHMHMDDPTPTAAHINSFLQKL